MSSLPTSRRGPHTTLIMLLAFMALVASACGGSTATDAAPVESASEQVAEAAPAASNPLTGQFDTVAGTSIDLADFEGENVVMWFWEPW